MRTEATSINSNLPDMSAGELSRAKGSAVSLSELPEKERRDLLEQLYGDRIKELLLEDRPQLAAHLPDLTKRVIDTLMRERADSSPVLAAKRVEEVTQALRHKYSVNCKEPARELVERFDSYVRRIVASRINDPHLVEDICQEIFIKLLERLDGYNPKRSAFITWVKIVATNYTTDCLRRQAVRSRVTATGDMGDVSAPAQSESTANEGNHTNAKHVMACMDQLRQEERDVLELTYLRGLTLREAANLLGISIGTCKSRCHRGTINLRELVIAAASENQHLTPRGEADDSPVDQPRSGPQRCCDYRIEHHSGEPYIVVKVPKRQSHLLHIGTDGYGVLQALHKKGGLEVESITMAAESAANRIDAATGAAWGRAAQLLVRSILGETTERESNFVRQCGIPFGVMIRNNVGEIVRILPPSQPPYLVELEVRCRRAFAQVERNYIAVGRELELAEIKREVERATLMLGLVFDLRRKGWTAKQVAECVERQFGESLNESRISTWITGRKLPEPIAMLLSNQVRRGSVLVVPRGGSQELSYILGVHLATTHVASHSPQFSLTHVDPMVVRRCRDALDRVGISEGVEGIDRGMTRDRHTLRVRSADLCGFLYEQTDGYTRLPWAYLVRDKEKRAFLGGFTDAGGVVLTDRVRFCKQGAANIFEELSILLADLGVLSNPHRADKATLTILSAPELRSFRAVVGARYAEFDSKLSQLCRHSGREHPSLQQFQAFERARRAVGDSATAISEYLHQREGVTLDRANAQRWLQGTRPLAVLRHQRIQALRRHYPDIEEMLHLGDAGVPRYLIPGIMARRVNTA